MSERKLASVQTIKELKPIPGADRIELATFQGIGWACVVKKGEFSPGDLCCYFEIDSIVPDIPVFDFLKDRRRIKTVKLRGQISQGLALRLGDFFDGTTTEGVAEANWLQDGDDLTERLNVEKYEPNTNPFNPRVIPSTCRAFPFHLGLQKTDETRVQSEPELLEAIQGKPYVITLKMDGMSGTFGYTDEEKLIVCSRNLWLYERDNSAHWQVAERFGLEEKLNWSPQWFLQGEVCGPTIQGNKMGFKDKELYIFNIFDTDDKKYLDPLSVQGITSAIGLKPVPIVKQGRKFSFTQEQLLELAKGNYPGTDNPREGIVIRSQDGLISFKVINQDFLLNFENE